MKKIKFHYIAAFFILAGTSFLGSCSSDIESDGGIDNNPNALVPVKVIMQGYQDLDDANPTTRSNIEGNPSDFQVFQQESDIPGYDIVTTIQKTSLQEVKTRASMEANSRFRMLIYDASGNQQSDCTYQVNGTSATLVTGTAPSLAPGSYKFVCYTNNTSTASTTSPITVSNGEDFATFCVTKTISSTDNTVAVSFVRQICEFQITATASGFENNTVTFEQAEVANLYTSGTWNADFGSSDDTGLAVIGSTTFSCTNNTAYKGLPLDRDMTINLKKLTIGGVSKGDKVVSVSTRLAKGKRYMITISFTKRADILLADVIWAPGNLLLEGGVYKFYENQEQYSGIWNGGDYYSFNTTDPLAYTYASTGAFKPANDPCTRVAPAGKWKTPTQTDFENLLRIGYKWGELNGRKGQFFGPQGQLFLPACGYREKKQAITQSGMAALYWTSNINNGYGILLGIREENNVAKIDLKGHRALGAGIRCVAAK